MEGAGEVKEKVHEEQLADGESDDPATSTYGITIEVISVPGPYSHTTYARLVRYARVEMMADGEKMLAEKS